MIENDFKDLIYDVRGKSVVLVRDLARLYNIETRVLNQIIKRNIALFNEDSYFQMLDNEFVIWKSQFVTSKSDKAGLRKSPYVVTKEGIIVLSGLLKSEISKNINSILLKVFDEKINDKFFKNELADINFSFKSKKKIEDLIYEINGKQVMLDSDLAKLYDCKYGTKEINQAVKNNIEKFPLRYSYILSEDEILNLRSKILTSSLKNTHGGRRYKIRVFTEQGVAMLATVIKSDVATEISIGIMDAFVIMRHFIVDNSFLLESNIKIRNELENQKQKLLEHDEKFEVLFSKFENKEQKELLFFDGQIFDAYSKIVDILKLAKSKLIIIDSYADKSVLEMISRIKVNVILVTKQNKSLSALDIKKYMEQYDNLKIVYDDSFYDRYIIIDNKYIYHCGASLNHAGKRTFSIDKLEDNDLCLFLLSKTYKIIEKRDKLSLI